MNLEQQIKATIRSVPNFPEDGIDFKDISPIFSNPELSKQIINQFVEKAKGKVDVVCGIESRGFIFGFPIALALDVPFILIRKKGKLPPPTTSIEYNLEYGSAALEVIDQQIPKNARVMIHDDVLATGGTAMAATKLVESFGADVTQYTFLVALDFLHGKQKLKDVETISLVQYE